MITWKKFKFFKNNSNFQRSHFKIKNSKFQRSKKLKLKIFNILWNISSTEMMSKYWYLIHLIRMRHWCVIDFHIRFIEIPTFLETKLSSRFWNSVHQYLRKKSKIRSTDLLFIFIVKTIFKTQLYLKLNGAQCLENTWNTV